MGSCRAIRCVMSCFHDTTSTRIPRRWINQAIAESYYAALALLQSPHLQLPGAANKRCLSERASQLLDTGASATVPGGVMKFALRCWKQKIGMTAERISRIFKTKVWSLMSPWQTREGAGATWRTFKSEYYMIVSKYGTQP